MAINQAKLNLDIIKIIRGALNFGLRTSFLKIQGRELAEQIKRRTRLGKGVNDRGQTYRLAPLKDSTIDHRERYDFGLSSFTTTTRSNLTATGQLLDSLVGSASGQEITVTARENRKREIDGSPARSRHADMIRGLESGKLGRATTTPRPFFRASNAEKNQIARKIRQEILKGLKL